MLSEFFQSQINYFQLKDGIRESQKSMGPRVVIQKIRILPRMMYLAYNMMKYGYHDSEIEVCLETVPAEKLWSIVLSMGNRISRGACKVSASNSLELCYTSKCQAIKRFIASIHEMPQVEFPSASLWWKRDRKGIRFWVDFFYPYYQVAKNAIQYIDAQYQILQPQRASAEQTEYWNCTRPIQMNESLWICAFRYDSGPSYVLDRILPIEQYEAIYGKPKSILQKPRYIQFESSSTTFALVTERIIVSSVDYEIPVQALKHRTRRGKAKQILDHDDDEDEYEEE